MPPAAPPIPAAPDAPADVDQLFDAFRATRDSQQMLALAAAAPDNALDALESAVEARLAAAAEDEATALRGRLESLRSLRTE